MAGGAQETSAPREKAYEKKRQDERGAAQTANGQARKGICL
jgi:hypothetical protein